jgi:hypothetical protein
MNQSLAQPHSNVLLCTCVDFLMNWSSQSRFATVFLLCPNLSLFPPMCLRAISNSFPSCPMLHCERVLAWKGQQICFRSALLSSRFSIYSTWGRAFCGYSVVPCTSNWHIRLDSTEIWRVWFDPGSYSPRISSDMDSSRVVPWDCLQAFSALKMALIRCNVMYYGGFRQPSHCLG